MATAKLNFDMTPQLQEILQREAGSLIHPSMKSDRKLDNMLLIYNLGMTIPEPNNKKVILLWLD